MRTPCKVGAPAWKPSSRPKSVPSTSPIPVWYDWAVGRSELDKRQLAGMRARIGQLEEDLEDTRHANFRASQRASELEETATKLTEWNSRLEADNQALRVDLERTRQESTLGRKEFEGELLDVTQKRMDLLQEYSSLEARYERLQVHPLRS